MKDNNAKLELLKKQQWSLNKELSAVSDKISKLVETQLLSAYTKRYVDTYWVKKNGYNKKNTWPVYIHVRAVKDIWEENGINCILACDTFQSSNDDEITIVFGYEEHVSYLGKPITKSAYEKARQALLEKLRKQL
jgi:hypothetical protein